MRDTSFDRALFWYDQIVPDFRVIRAIVALICIALLVLCAAVSPSAAHLDAAIPVLAFCFFALLAPFALRLVDRDSVVLPSPSLTVHSSRAPPQA